MSDKERANMDLIPTRARNVAFCFFAASLRLMFVVGGLALLVAVSAPAAQAPASKKVFMVTDMEGVAGIFSRELQCDPWKSPRWEESRKLLTGEINAAVAGLYEGGATDVVVLDGHDGSTTLSVLEIDPRAHLLQGTPLPPMDGLDASFGALIFIGQHAMAGADKAVLSHTESSRDIENLWVNNRPTGEIGIVAALAGQLGVPTIMLSGDKAACEELHTLVPEAECAEVKSAVSRTAALMLSHPAACSLIREKARRAMDRLPQIKPYKLAGPVEIKIEFTPWGTGLHQPREGVERVNDRTWVLRGKDMLEAWKKYSTF